jgi:hypothetical protein
MMTEDVLDDELIFEIPMQTEQVEVYPLQTEEDRWRQVHTENTPRRKDDDILFDQLNVDEMDLLDDDMIGEESLLD